LTSANKKTRDTVTWDDEEAYQRLNTPYMNGRIKIPPVSLVPWN
jgi:hypothetical protein